MEIMGGADVGLRSRVLRLRFQKRLPADVIDAVKAQSDAAKLTVWLDAAVTAATPEEFQAALGQ